MVGPLEELSLQGADRRLRRTSSRNLVQVKIVNRTSCMLGKLVGSPSLELEQGSTPFASGFARLGVGCSVEEMVCPARERRSLEPLNL